MLRPKSPRHRTCRRRCVVFCSIGAPQVHQDIERCASTRQVVFHAAYDERATMSCPAFAYFLCSEPYCADNSAIERPVGVMRAKPARKRKAKVSGIAGKCLPAIYAD